MLLWLATAGAAQTLPQVALELLVDGLELPVAGALDEGGKLYIAGLEGEIRVLDGSTLQPQPLLDLRDRVTGLEGEQGLFAVALHPDFPSDPRLFVSYTERGSGDLLIDSYRLRPRGLRLFGRPPPTADPASRLELLRIAMLEPFHHGGFLAFGPDGYLYISVGDGVRTPELRLADPKSQDPSALHGKILRLDVDRGEPYAVPADNPFVGVDGARPEVYALGLRNPWKFSFDPPTGRLFVVDVGEDRWEEIDLVTAGGNYGWPLFEGFECFLFPDGSSLLDCNDATASTQSLAAANGMPLLPPIAVYGHLQLDPAGGNAVTGGLLYRGRALPELRGSYLFGDFVSGRLWALRPQGDSWQRTLLLETGFNVGAIMSDERGEPLIFDLNGGALYRLVPPR